MKVLVVLGSPSKKGCSSTIANAFAAEAGKLGAEVDVFHLNSLDYKGCQGCMACKMKREDCAVRDDLTAVLEGHHEADIVVWASPVYFFDTSGQFKSFIDRAFSFAGPDFHSNPDSSRLPQGKKGLLVLSQGAHFFQHYDTAARYELFMKFAGIKETEVIRATEMTMPSKEALQPFVEQAEALARKMVG